MPPVPLTVITSLPPSSPLTRDTAILSTRSRAGQSREPNMEYRDSSSSLERVLVVSMLETDWEMVTIMRETVKESSMGEEEGAMVMNMQRLNLLVQSAK